MFPKTFQVLFRIMSATGAEFFYIIIKFWKRILGVWLPWGGGSLELLQGGGSLNLATRRGGSPAYTLPPAYV